MKKKILCLLLILFMLPIGFVLAGCSSNSYNMSNLTSDYSTITKDCTSFKMRNSGEIYVDYSVYKDTTGKTYLKNIIDTTEPFKQLKSFYNKLFDNSMVFAYEYLDVCAQKDIEVSAELSMEVKASLNQLKEAIHSVDNENSHLASVVRSTDFSEQGAEEHCMYALSNVFAKYETLLEASLNFNNALTRVYFGYALPSSNVDYSKYYVDDSTDDLNFKNQATVTLAIYFLTPKAKNQIVNLTQCLFELNIKAGDLPSKLTTKPYKKPGAFFDDYIEKIEELDMQLDGEEASRIVKDGEKAKAMLADLVRLYNVQNVITNNTEVYRTAFATIKYLKVKNNYNNSTTTEKICANLIENYNETINDYQEILSLLISFVERV